MRLNPTTSGNGNIVRKSSSWPASRTTAITAANKHCRRRRATSGPPCHRIIERGRKGPECERSSSMISAQLKARGFLPEQDPLIRFPAGSQFSALDGLGQDLPSLLHDKGFRAFA